MKKIIFLTILFWIPNLLTAQNVPDSLLQRSYDELLNGFNYSTAFEEKELYGNAYVKKAKNDDNASNVVTGYHLLAYIYKNDVNVLKYCDSIIALTENSPGKLYPASAYSIKGSFYYKKRAYIRALDAFLLAYNAAKKQDNKDIIFRSTYAIGALKDKIGDNDGALQIHRENLAHAKQHIDVLSKDDYLNAIFALADTFNDLKMLDSATYYNRFGVLEALRLESERKYYHFVLNSGVTHYHEANFQSALDSIKKGLPYFEAKGDQLNTVVGYYYLGKSYFEIEKKEEAIAALKKVDTIFQQSRNTLPEIRESYTLLIDHCERKNKLEQQIHYMKQVMKHNSILYDGQLYLNKTLINDYDRPKELAKAEAEAMRKQRMAKVIIGAVSGLLVITLLLLGYQYRKKAFYKRQAEMLASKKEDIILPTIPGRNRNGKQDIGIPEEVVNKIVSYLQTIFEGEKGYLDPEVKLPGLARRIGTNVNHLSRVINDHKEDSFPNYTNRLRIEHALNSLKINFTYRRYTIKALAEEFGFNRVETFNRAFIRHAKTTPRDYIEKLADQ